MSNMARKSGLGRGLDALIPTAESQLPSGSVTFIPVDQIQPNPRQPRSHFDPEELTELSASIRAHGVIQPLLVTRDDSDGKYILIAGERRLLAAREAALDVVPAIIREVTQQELVELALVENVQRADLGPLETAEAYRQLVEEFNLSHEQIAEQVGKSRVTVTNTLRLLKLPASVQEALAKNEISEGHARALLALPSPQAQSAALQTILLKSLNVRQTEELVRRLTGEKVPAAPVAEKPAEVAALEERLRERLGTRVALNPTKKGGTLVIHYYSDEELDSLIEMILGSNSEA